MKTLFLLLTASLTVVLAQSVPAHVQDVRSIYVEPLTGSSFPGSTLEGLASMMNAKIIGRLAKTRVTITEDADKADAILHGEGMVNSSTNGYGRTFYQITMGIRLVNKDGVVLWADDITSSRYAKSATSSIAETIAKRLGQALFEK
jgi:hypothetical protein